MTTLPGPHRPVDAGPARPRLVVVGGIDTHKDLHVAAVLDERENVLGTRGFSTTRAGYRALIRWMREFGDLSKVGIEGTGSYGAGITRHLADVDVEVIEVDRPDRSDRRRKGKDDDLDAINAGRAALRGHRTSTPESKNGKVESLRVLRVVRSTALKSRRVALQMLRAQIVSGPEELRDQVRGDNTTRIRSEAAFAKMCGACPIPAGSRKTNGRHRLYRGGNRQANAALYRAVIVRLRWHQPTIDYTARRTAEGLSKREIIRCLKRYLAREIYHLLPPVATPDQHAQPAQKAA